MAAAKDKKPSASMPRIRPVPAVSRAIAILRLLGRTPEPLGVKAIATSLSMVPSTCLHILRVLVAEGLVTVENDTKRYTLGSGILSIARSAIERSGFATLVQPVLDRLAKTWEVTTIGVEISDPEHMVAIAISRSRIPFALHVEVGSRFPALLSATGRLYAAFGDLPWPHIETAFKSLRWDRPLSFSAWKKEVEQARKAGYAVDRDQYINGVTVVAVPLLDAKGKLTYTLAGAGLSEQTTTSRIEDMAGDMMKEARTLSRQIIT